MATNSSRTSPRSRASPARRAAALFAALLLGIGTGSDSVGAQSTPTPPEALPASGAAYRTGKSMFLGLRKVEVVGITSTVRVALEQGTTPGSRRVVVAIGATDFDSGEPARDEWVAETLGGPEGSPLRFTSISVQAAGLSDVLSGRGLELPGTLLLPEGPRDLTFSVATWDLPARDGEGTERFLEAWARTTFEALDIEVPKVGPGGAIASPSDDLELWLRVPVAEVRDLLTPESLPRPSR